MHTVVLVIVCRYTDGKAPATEIESSASRGESTGPTNGNAQEWHPFIFPFLDKHSKRGMHSKYRFQSLKRYRFHSNGTFKRGLPRGMENGENIRMHSNAFECLKNHHWGGGGGPGLGFGSQQLCCLHYVADAAANFQ